MKRMTRQSGFTIIELMIATVVFTIILLIVTGAIVQIGRLYYKGMTAARTQEVTRSVADDIGQGMQFNNGQFIDGLTSDDDPNTFGYCLGNKLYSYRPGQQVRDNQHALVVQTVNSSCQSHPLANMSAPLQDGQKELLGENMRLAILAISPVGTNRSTYTITVRVVYGDDELLCNDELVADTCGVSDTIDLNENTIPHLRCKNIRDGSQFCSMSELSTTVERRHSGQQI